MKLSEIRPCDNCGGKLKGGIFYVVRSSIAVVDNKALNELMGMTQYFQGAAALAAVFTPRGEDVITVAGDDPKHKELQVEIFLCSDCYVRDINLAMLAEKVEELKAKPGVDDGDPA